MSNQPDRLANWTIVLFVLAGAQICWGLYSLCGSAMGAFAIFFQEQMFARMGQQPPSDPLNVMLRENVVLRGWTIGALVIGTLCGIAYVAAGVGLFLRKPLARTASLWTAGIMLAIALIGFIVQMVYMFPVLMEMTKSTTPGEKEGAIGGLVATASALCCAPVFPVLVILVLTRAIMTEIFAPYASPPAPTV